MNGTLLDANLLCLLVVGRIDRSAISSHPRLKAFDGDDYVNLCAILDKIGDPVFCPHVLAETSNLLGFRQSPPQMARWLASLADLIGMFAERGEPTIMATRDSAYHRLGLTDALLLVLAANQSLALVSDDLGLCMEAQRRGATAINYNYVREGALSIADL